LDLGCSTDLACCPISQVHNATIITPKSCCAMHAGIRKNAPFCKLDNYKIVPRIKLFSQVSHAKIIDPKNCCNMHAGTRKRLHFVSSTIIKLFYTGSQLEFTCSYISKVECAINNIWAYLRNCIPKKWVKQVTPGNEQKLKDLLRTYGRTAPGPGGPRFWRRCSWSRCTGSRRSWNRDRWDSGTCCIRVHTTSSHQVSMLWDFFLLHWCSSNIS